MLSYLQIVSKITSQGIYDRGVRDYLEGKLVSKKDLILDNWREYECVSKRDRYIVKIPVLHLALSPYKEDQAEKALQEVVSCTCEYYQEGYGICKHIVMACADLDNEFSIKLQQQKEKVAKKDLDSVLDGIFVAEKTRVQNEFFTELDRFLNTSSYLTLSFIDKAAKNINIKQDEYTDFFKKLEALLKSYLRSYETEKKVIKLVYQTLSYGRISWYLIWHNLFTDFIPKNQFKILISMWQVTRAGIKLEYSDLLQSFFVGLETDIKTEIFEFLKAIDVLNKL